MPKGSVVCRNIGFDHSKGKYICHLDADDLVSDTFVEQRVSFMESHPELDYTSFPAKSFTDKNKLPSCEDAGYTWGISKENSDMLKDFSLKEYCKNALTRPMMASLIIFPIVWLLYYYGSNLHPIAIMISSLIITAIVIWIIGLNSTDRTVIVRLLKDKISRNNA